MPVRPTRRLTTFVAAFLLAAAAPLAGQEIDPPKQNSYRIFGQLTTLFERNLTGPEPIQPNRLQYSKFRQLASFNIEWKRMTVGVQAEFLEWSVIEEHRDRLDFDRLRDGFELRRYFFDYQSDLFSGRLGTYFASLGRGMTLYVQKNEALQFDEPIHGASARVNLKRFDISALWGQVTEPVQQAQFGREFSDEVMGARIRAKLPFDTYLGGSAARAELERPFPVEVDDGRLITDDVVEVWAVEAGANGLWGVLDLAGEFSNLRETIPTSITGVPFREIDGHGRYLSASVYAGPLSILAEYKDYYNFAYRYNLPPNAGRANENYEHDDVKGPRLLVSADFWEIGSLFHASYSEFDNRAGEDHQREWYAGIEQTIGRVYFEGSYFDRAYINRGLDESHILADFHLTVGRRGEIILGYDQRLEQSDYSRFETTRSFLAYSISPWGTASLRYSYEDKSRVGREDFWGVELQYLPKPSIIITLFGGGDPGGLVCAGGQCRIEPRFKGYRLNFTWRF